MNFKYDSKTTSNKRTGEKEKEKKSKKKSDSVKRATHNQTQ